MEPTLTTDDFYLRFRNRPDRDVYVPVSEVFENGVPWDEETDDYLVQVDNRLYVKRGQLFAAVHSISTESW